jgi:hypothetical protein
MGLAPLLVAALTNHANSEAVCNQVFICLGTAAMPDAPLLFMLTSVTLIQLIYTNELYVPASQNEILGIG